MDIFEELDNATWEDDLVLPSRVCDNCSNESKELSRSFWTSNFNIDYCQECFQKANFTKLFNVIDRTNEPDRPQIWPCVFCHTMTCGGHKWYNLNELDICGVCFQDPDIQDKIRALFAFVDENVMASERTMDTVLLDISKAERNMDIIPQEIRAEITTDRVELWTELIGSFAHLNVNHKEFGSIRNWVIFTELYKLPSFPATTGLLIDCKSGRVASLVLDDHGRMGVDIVFESVSDYLSAEKTWRESITDAERSEMQEKVKTDLITVYSCEEEDMAFACEEFSGYIRNIRKLGMYYG